MKVQTKGFNFYSGGRDRAENRHEPPFKAGLTAPQRMMQLDHHFTSLMHISKAQRSTDPHMKALHLEAAKEHCLASAVWGMHTSRGTQWTRDAIDLSMEAGLTEDDLHRETGFTDITKR